MKDFRAAFEAAIAPYPEVERERFAEAAAFAEASFGDLPRPSGIGTFAHSLETAEIVAAMGLDADAVIAALLHEAPRAARDAVALAREVGDREGSAGADIGRSRQVRTEQEARRAEDAAVSAAAEVIGKRFGEGPRALVEGLARLSALKARNKTIQAAETIRSMFFAMTKDLRVILVKLACELAGMRGLKGLPEDEARRVAGECLDVYAPLADRLGISSLKDELEDLSLKTLNREAFDQIKLMVAGKKREREEYLRRVESAILEAAAAEGLSAEVSSRAKHFYSIYMKMRRRAKSAEEIYDLMGIRIFAGTEGDCYALLGLVHRLWPPIERRFKDYIAMPKANGYRSVHTTVMCFDGRPLEVQIRTRAMEEIAEHGIASHWLYKKGSGAERPSAEALPLVNRMKDWGGVDLSSGDFLEEIRRELLKDSIFVFTPRGDVVQLPSGSTPLDFAFAVHTDVGLHCLGARVDGRVVPLDFPLSNTQSVDIHTSQSARPNVNWLRIVRSAKARAKIRAWLMDNGYALAIDRNIVVKGRPEEEEAPVRAEERPPVELEFRRTETGLASDAGSAGLSIQGNRGLLVRFAGCCRPVTGDPIVGYVSRGRGVIVHRADCPNLPNMAESEQRSIEVVWERGNPGLSRRFRILSEPEAELFSAIEAAIKKFGARLAEGRVRERPDGLYEGWFGIEAPDVQSLKRASRGLRSLPSVTKLSRWD